MGIQKWKFFFDFLSCEFSFDSGGCKIFWFIRLHISFSSYSFKIIECHKQGHLKTDLGDSFDAKTQNAIRLFSEIKKTIEWVSIPIAHSLFWASFAQVSFNVIVRLKTSLTSWVLGLASGSSAK